MHSVKKNVICHPTTTCEEDETELRRGPWTLEEDTLLIHYIARHGEGHWNLLAKRAGLKRTGKSCRLRWLNYLKPDIKRGNLTPQEQFLILELHSKWGNRWSKIAQHLPGRTDNEIKNYWRTRVQKQARLFNIESNSKRFIDAVRCFWMPRLLQKVEQSSTSSTSSSTNSLSSTSTIVPSIGDRSYEMSSLNIIPSLPQNNNLGVSDSPQSLMMSQNKHLPISIQPNGCLNPLTDFSFQSMPQIEEEPKPYTISDSFALGHEYITNSGNIANDVHHFESINSVHYVDMMSSNDYGIEAGLNLGHSFDIPGLSCHMAAYDWSMDDMASDTLWNMGEM